MADTISWVDAAGTTHPLHGASVLDNNGRKVQFREGFFAPPVRFSEDLDPQREGAFLRHIESGPREVAVGLFSTGGTAAQHRTRLREIASFLDPIEGEGALVVIPDGMSARRLPCRYVGGFELTEDATQHTQGFQFATLVFRATDPLWQDAAETVVDFSEAGSVTTSTHTQDRPPTIGESASGAGDATWNNPQNITIEPGIASTGAIDPGTETKPLRARGYGFSIPSSATIRGIQVFVLRRNRRPPGEEWGRTRDVAVRVVKDGAAVGDNKAATAVNWPQSLEYRSYGGPADLWGTTWTPAQINSDQFGAQIRAIKQVRRGDARVAHIAIAVTFTLVGRTWTQVIDNTGDKLTWPRFIIPDAGENPAFRNVTTGERFEIEGTIDSTVTVETNPRSDNHGVRDAAGNNLYPDLTIGSTLWPLEPGENEIEFSLVSAPASSTSEIRYRNRYLTA